VFPIIASTSFLLLVDNNWAMTEFEIFLDLTKW
jgi:hypothetical protein